MEEKPVVNNPIQQSTVKPVPPKPNHWLIAIIIFVLLIVIGGIYMRNLQLRKQMIPPPPEPPLPPKITLQPSPNQDETANWKTYTGKYFTLKYSPFYTPTEKFIPLKGGEPIFIVTDKFNFDRNKIASCDTKTYEVKPCLNPGKNHSQEKDIQPIILDGKNAVSFFMVVPNQEGGSDVLHVAQTVEDPLIEIALSIAGMGGEETFSQILSTFKFTNPEDQVVCTADVKECPDGSYVSRQPPNCEFAECP